MLAEESVRAGNLEQALAQLQNAVRDDPANVKLRVFLFQLMAVLGEWERALTQLNVAGEMDAGTLAMVQTYRQAIQCEALRAQVFAGQRTPLVLGEPEQWVALLTQVVRLTANGQYRQARPLREEAFELAPATAGSITVAGEDQPQRFEWLADADSRFGPLLEAIVSGHYYWIPSLRVRRIQIEPPADLRDVVWMPAYFTWANGGQAAGLIPTRYPGSESSDDNQIRLARKTEWDEHEGDAYFGRGQRLLATDAGEYPLMSVREIQFDG